jgi:hypothetical protein
MKSWVERMRIYRRKVLAPNSEKAKQSPRNKSKNVEQKYIPKRKRAPKSSKPWNTPTPQLRCHLSDTSTQLLSRTWLLQAAH